MGETQANHRFRVPGERMNLCDVFLDRNLREGRAERVALIVDHPEHGVRRVSYAELAAEASRFGHLLAERGVGMEDRVLIVLEDGLDWAAAFFGALKIGATCAFVNPALSDVELGFYLEDTRARAIVAARSEMERLPSETPFLKARVTVDDPMDRGELDGCPTTLGPAPTMESDLAIWLYTSGSTGAPKAAVHRAKDFVFNTERYAKGVLQMSEADITLSVPKLFFGYATGSNLLFPLYFGGAAVLFPDKPTPERLIELTERHRATVLVNVPTMIARMATTLGERSPAPDLSSLRLLTSAGEALPPELYRRWHEATGVEILDGIGSAEMFHVFISARLGEVEPGSLGTLVEGYDARIVGPDGQEVPEGETGLLHIGGPSSAAFYFNRSEESRAVLQGHWVRTQDLMRRDARGYYWYQGRAGDTLKVAGRWFQPQEVEACLTEADEVAEAGVSAYAHEGLTKPMAFVVLAPGVERSAELEASLRERVATQLAPFKAPRFIEVLEQLPRGDRDKLDRPALAKLAEARAAEREGR